MAKMFKAMMDDKTVLVAMLRSDKSLTVYPYISEEETDMTVISNVARQKITVQESGIVTLQADSHLNPEDRRALSIGIDSLEKTTRGTWTNV